jgi:hypothetical protein
MRELHGDKPYESSDDYIARPDRLDAEFTAV